MHTHFAGNSVPRILSEHIVYKNKKYIQNLKGLHTESRRHTHTHTKNIVHSTGIRTKTSGCPKIADF